MHPSAGELAYASGEGCTIGTLSSIELKYYGGWDGSATTGWVFMSADQQERKGRHSEVAARGERLLSGQCRALDVLHHVLGGVTHLGVMGVLVFR